jgi:GNAT superfamily N-acetyltransferase
MLAMDIPVALMTGMVLAEAGKGLIKSEDKEKNSFLTVVVLMYAAIFIAPTPVYYFLGWPGWECNFVWAWVDHINDSPLRAAFSYVLLAVAVIPTYLGLLIGRHLIRKGKEKANRIGYIVMLILVGVIILLLKDITLNVSSTYAEYKAGQSYSFWSHPFVTGWAITSLYFWGSLVCFYLWLRKKK